MQLQHIDLKDLKLSPLNVRKHGEINGDDLVPSIRSIGVVQPLLVRPNCDGFEIIAGQRRFMACQSIAENTPLEPLPCVIMQEGDDAKAIEASLAENIARLPMDELDQYEAFLSLTKQGQSIEDIAAHFCVSEKLVKQRLAIANLYAPILNAYRKEEIEPSTIRLLTMASIKQQKAWYKLFKNDDEPRYYNLKSWLFGGDEIPTENALFDLESYEGAIIADLFGDETDSYFSDCVKFWHYQSRAIAELKSDLESEGWSDVILLDVGENWQRWDYESVSLEEGGKVYIHVRANGEVKIRKGLLPIKEAKRLALVENGENVKPAKRPELTKSMQNYLDLHRHAAVRADLLNHQGSALRLAVAQIIAGSSLWEIVAEPQKAVTDAIKQSLEVNEAQQDFDKKRLDIRKLIDNKDIDEKTLVYKKHNYGKSHDLIRIFIKLLSLSDKEVKEVLTFVVAETLPSSSDMVELLGDIHSVDMKSCWSPDETFFDLLRNKEAINAMLKDIGSKAVADGNISATAKVQKQIIKDFLSGTRTPQKSDWHPRYMTFPMQGYTKRQETISVVKSGKVLAKILRAA